ncbi:MAG TPA: hypothetical protein VJ978_09605 [Nitriliruptoraceae bacterium]|nr:hypothetical protein [Nitriliruptoraceae bacterium]
MTTPIGNETAGDAVRATFDHLAGVVGSYGAHRLARFADRIPRQLTSYVGVELPLGTRRPSPDFLVHIAQPEHLAAPVVREALAPFESDLVGLERAMREAPAYLTQPLHDAWLEWDLSNPCFDRPSVFAAPSQPDSSGANAVWVYEAIAGRPASAPMRLGAEAFGRSLRGHGMVTQVGVMAPPRLANCRIVVDGSDLGTLVAAATDGGWPGSVADAENLASLGGSLGVHGLMDLDLGSDGFLPSLGIELSIADDAAHHRVIDAVRDAGLCHPELAAALRRWPFAVVPGDTDAFPARLVRTQAFLGSHVRVAVIGWVNHVKISTSAQGSPAAKAYLGIRECVLPVSRPGEVPHRPSSR